jgi:hypothetical protein
LRHKDATCQETYRHLILVILTTPTYDEPLIYMSMPVVCGVVSPRI